jgi:hypothetical protein
MMERTQLVWQRMASDNLTNSGAEAGCVWFRFGILLVMQCNCVVL